MFIKLILGLSLPLALFGSVSATTVWDVRSTATAGDVNGGGFDLATGSCATNWSLQDAAHIGYTDLVIGAVTTTYTSVLNSPTTGDVRCNVVHIVSGAGCTAGWYLVTSVAAGVATVSGAMGTASSTCVANLGGALVTIHQGSTNAISGNVVYVKGSFTITGTVTVDSNKLQFFIRGYGTTQGDSGTATITTSTNSARGFDINNGGDGPLGLSNFLMTNTAGGAKGVAIISTLGSTYSIVNVRIDGWGGGVHASAATTPRAYFSGVEIKNSTSHGIVSFVGIMQGGNYIHNNGGSGIVMIGTNPELYINGSILSSNTVNGVLNTGTGGRLYISRSVLANNSGDGINASSATAQYYENNIIYGNTGQGIDSTIVITNTFARLNAYGSNSGGNFTNYPASSDDITLTGDPFTSSTNFALNNTAGAGALLRATGFPGVFPGGTTTGFIDVGPVQTAGAAPSATIGVPSGQ